MINNDESRRVRLTKKMIRDALCELMEQKPLQKITIKEICEFADVNRSTFYAYYQSQFELLEEIEEIIIEKTPSVNIRTEQNLDLKLKTAFEYINKNKNIYKVLFANTVANSFKKRVLNKLFNLASEDSEWLKSIDIKDETKFLMVMSAFGSIPLVEKWVSGEISAEPYELANAVSTFIKRNCQNMHQY